MESAHPLIRTRLSVMMFIEFFLWASWYVPLGGYANDTLKLSGGQIGWLYATTAIAAMISPMFVGYVADRLFSTERVLAVLHLIGGVCLFLAAEQETFLSLMTLLVINALCFMPTLALVNSLSFRNIDDPDRFSRIAVWGTIGWIVSGLIVGFLLGGTTKYIFYLAGGGAIAMAAYSLTLPHTPPKGAEGGGDVLGLGALKLLKEPSFLVFALCAFLISIPLSFYFTWGNAFLVQTDRPRPTALMTLAQASEIIVMIIMPWFIGRIGLKNVLLIGMSAWVIRYLCFASLSFPLVILGLLVHGFCYCFVFVASFIYVSKKAPPAMSASAQSFIAFLMWGVGMFVGTQLSGYMAEQYPPVKIAAIEQGAVESAVVALPAWPDPEAAEEGEVVVSLAKTLGSDDDYKITRAVIDALPEEGVTIEELTYAKKDLVETFGRVDADADGTVTRAEWRIAQAYQWSPIWLWPCGLAAVVLVIFLLGGRDVTGLAEEEQSPVES
jgi:nucleoside transporter